MSGKDCRGAKTRKRKKEANLINVFELSNDANQGSNTSSTLNRKGTLKNTNDSSAVNIVTGSDPDVSVCDTIESIHDYNLQNEGVTISTINGNDMTLLSKDVLEISWEKIVASFTFMFENIFTENSKLYFDVARKKLDGATVKWCPIILLDTLISFATENSIKLKCNEALKRKFNQYNALHKAICDVVSETYVANSYYRLIKTRNHINNYTEIFTVNINIVDIPNEWTTANNFKIYTCYPISTSKINYKVNEMVDRLISHDIIKEKEIMEVVKTVVTNIYKKHFIIARVNNAIGLQKQDSNNFSELQTSIIDINRYVIYLIFYHQVYSIIISNIILYILMYRYDDHNDTKIIDLYDVYVKNNRFIDNH